MAWPTEDVLGKPRKICVVLCKTWPDRRGVDHAGIFCVGDVKRPAAVRKIANTLREWSDPETGLKNLSGCECATSAPVAGVLLSPKCVRKGGEEKVRSAKWAHVMECGGLFHPFTRSLRGSFEGPRFYTLASSNRHGLITFHNPHAPCVE